MTKNHQKQTKSYIQNENKRTNHKTQLGYRHKTQTSNFWTEKVTKMTEIDKIDSKQNKGKDKGDEDEVK